MWRERICGGHGRELCPMLEPCEQFFGLRHPVGCEQGGGDLPFEGIASPFHQPQLKPMCALFAHIGHEDYHTHCLKPRPGETFSLMG